MKSKTSCKLHQPGFALLIVLISIAIIAILYMMDMRAIFSPQTNAQRSPENQPWLEEELIVDENHLVDAPRPPKCTLEEPIKINTWAYADEAKRGDLIINISRSGLVEGTWDCEFEVDKKETTFKASFAGNIAPGKTFIDENGNEDPTALFFIARGKYIETVYNIRTNKGFPGAGEIFVTGWITHDRQAAGKLTLTTNRNTSFSYTWKH